MTINLDDYRVQVKNIKLFLDGKPGWKYKDEIGPLAIYCSTHIVAVSHYIGELYGFTDEIRAKIVNDCAFYHITEVINEIKL